MAPPRRSIASANGTSRPSRTSGTIMTIGPSPQTRLRSPPMAAPADICSRMIAGVVAPRLAQITARSMWIAEPAF